MKTNENMCLKAISILYAYYYIYIYIYTERGPMDFLDDSAINCEARVLRRAVQQQFQA